MAGLRVYGLDEAGEAVFADDLAATDRADLPALIERGLDDWHGVEVWDGPLCVVRMTRARRRVLLKT